MRKSILCSCVKHVFDQTGIACSESDLCKRFGIEKKDFAKGFTIIRKKVAETRQIKQDVLISLRQMFQQLNINKQYTAVIENIYIQAKNLKNHSDETFDEGPIFKDTNTKTIAAVVLCFWLQNRRESICESVNEILEKISNECQVQKHSLFKAFRECDASLRSIPI
jgi:hypothetical protein